MCTYTPGDRLDPYPSDNLPHQANDNVETGHQYPNRPQEPTRLVIRVIGWKKVVGVLIQRKGVKVECREDEGQAEVE